MDETNYTEKELGLILDQCYQAPLPSDMVEAMIMRNQRAIAKYRVQIKHIKTDKAKKIAEYMALPENERKEWLGRIPNLRYEPDESQIDQELTQIIADENARIDARIDARR